MVLGTKRSKKSTILAAKIKSKSLHKSSFTKRSKNKSQPKKSPNGCIKIDKSKLIKYFNKVNSKKSQSTLLTNLKTVKKCRVAVKSKI